MSRHAFRFLHASQLLLDEPLQDLVNIPDALREPLEDISLDAFDHLVAAAIEQEVAFVLLVGNCFVEQSASLRARIALLNGFLQLQEEQIPVYILPGEQDPIPAWRQIANLPENITLVTHTELKPLKVTDGSKTIATITAKTNTTLASNGPLPSSDAFRIVMQFAESEMAWSSQANHRDVDYLALGGTDRKTVNLDRLHVHCPGSLVGHADQQTGSHGASLIHVAADGNLREEFLALSPARRELRQITVTPQSNQQQIAQEMQRALQQVTPSANEEYLIFQWRFRGLGPLFSRLQQPLHQQQLLKQIQATTAKSSAEVLHQIELVADLEPAKNTSTENELTTEYLQHLNRLATDPDQFRQVIGQLAAELNLENPATQAQWNQFIKQVKREAIVEQCRHIGLQLFARPAA